MIVFDDYPLGAAVLKIFSAHLTRSEPAIRALGLYPGQEMILMALLRDDKQSQSALVQQLNVDHSTVAKSVSRLLKIGIVSTEKSTVDKRVSLVTLTPKGRALAEQVRTICRDIEESSLIGITDEDQAAFLRVADKIIHNLKNQD